MGEDKNWKEEIKDRQQNIDACFNSEVNTDIRTRRITLFIPNWSLLIKI